MTTNQLGSSLAFCHIPFFTIVISPRGSAPVLMMKKGLHYIHGHLSAIEPDPPKLIKVMKACPQCSMFFGWQMAKSKP